MTPGERPSQHCRRHTAASSAPHPPTDSRDTTDGKQPSCSQQHGMLFEQCLQFNTTALLQAPRSAPHACINSGTSGRPSLQALLQFNLACGRCSTRRPWAWRPPSLCRWPVFPPKGKSSITPWFNHEPCQAQVSIQDTSTHTPRSRPKPFVSLWIRGSCLYPWAGRRQLPCMYTCSAPDSTTSAGVADLTTTHDAKRATCIPPHSTVPQVLSG